MTHPSNTSRALPRIAVLATGGTIAGSAADASKTAGYKAGVVGVDKSARRRAGAIARGAHPRRAGREHRQQGHEHGALDRRLRHASTRCSRTRRYRWHRRHARHRYARGNGVSAASDVKTDKPVVLTAAMRPSSALSADGPLNLLERRDRRGVDSARGQGVLVAFNNDSQRARRRQDEHLRRRCVPIARNRRTRLGAGRPRGISAHRRASPHVRNAVRWRPALAARRNRHELCGGIAQAVDALVAAGVRASSWPARATARSIRSAGGTGRCRARGIAVVRASRVGSGHVMRNGAAPDDALGFVSAGTLNPYKARVLLMLALAAGEQDPTALQQIFDTY